MNKIVKTVRLYVKGATVVAALGLTTPSRAGEVRVDITPGHATNSFRPALALGAGIDRMPAAATDVVYAPDRRSAIA